MVRALLVAALLLVADRARAASPPAARCVAAKLTAVGRATHHALACAATTRARGRRGSSACLRRLGKQVSRAFARVERKVGCLARGDTFAIETRVDTLVSVLVAGYSGGATSVARACGATKIRVAGRRASTLLRCRATAIARATDVGATCLARAEIRYAAAFTKAARTGTCRTIGDARAMAAIVDTFVADIVTALTATTTTTSTTRPGSTTLPAHVTSTTSPPFVSFLSDIHPIFTKHCTECHGGRFPPLGLNLTSARAYADLVDLRSIECPTYDLVSPGAPDTSYLVLKLEGPGPCSVGAREPFGGPPLPEADIATIRAWIAAGAPDN